MLVEGREIRNILPNGGSLEVGPIETRTTIAYIDDREYRRTRRDRRSS